MASLTNLPNELLLQILEQTDSACLPALAVACRRMHGLVIPLLYSCVYFEGPTKLCHRWHEKPGLVLTMQDPRVKPTKIFHLSSFLRTIDESDDLRDLVSSVSLTVMLMHALRHPRALFKLRSSVSFLHLRPDMMDEVGLALDWSRSCALTSLNLQMEHFAREPELLYQVFCIPTLRDISFAAHIQWYNLNIPFDNERWGTSNVTSLSLIHCPPADAGGKLAEILMWPAALKTFRHIASKNLYRHRHSSHQATEVGCPRRIIAALNHHRRSLEELFLHGDWYGKHMEPEVADRLSRFTNLKYLGLLREHLALTRKELGAKPQELQASANTDMQAALPPSIQELHIELPRPIHPLNLPRSLFSNRGNEFNSWLTAIADLKSARFPHLQKIVLWYHDYRLDADIYFDPNELWRDFSILHILKDHGIALEYVGSPSSPLFGGWRRVM